MKSLYTLLFLLFMMSSSILAQDTLTIYFNKDWEKVQNKNMALYYRKAFLDHNKAWAVCDYYLNDTLQMTGNLKSKTSEIRHGHFVYYYENGKKQSEGDYSNDKKVGVWSGWHENGELKYKGNYLIGALDGVWQYWHENGQKKAEGKFLNNAETGLWVYWNDKGKLKSEEEYIGKNMVSIKGYSDNGKMISEGKIINNNKQGIWKYYNVDGRLTLQGSYKDNLQEGEWMRYFKNGSMKIIFKNGNIVNKQYGGIYQDE